MKKFSLILLIFFLNPFRINSFSFVERKWKFLLPLKTMEELSNIEADETLTPQEIEKLVDQIISNQPKNILDQLELPPYYIDAKWQIKDYLFDKEMSYQKKHEKIFNVIMNLPPEQKRFPALRSSESENSPAHSKMFESYNALQYSKLKELREVLPPEASKEIYDALRNTDLNIDEKLEAVEKVMSDLDFETLDRLFFVGVPIVDADVRERFRRLWYDKPYWSTDTNQKVTSSVTSSANTGNSGPYSLGASAYSNIPQTFTDNFKSTSFPGSGTSPKKLQKYIKSSNEIANRFCVDCAPVGVGASAREAAQLHIPSIIPQTTGSISNKFILPNPQPIRSFFSKPNISSAPNPAIEPPPEVTAAAVAILTGNENADPNNELPNDLAQQVSLAIFLQKV